MGRHRKYSFTDEVFSISTREIVAALKSAGTWPRLPRAGFWSGGAEVSPGVFIRRKSDREVALSAPREGVGLIESVLPLSVASGRLGGHYGLVKCPRCNRVRTRFYLDGAEFACRECLKLSYRSKNRTQDQRRAAWVSRFPTGRPKGMHRATWARYERRFA